MSYLSWKALFEKLDRGTSGSNSFNGPIGQKCQEEGMQDIPQVQFNPITTLVTLPYKVLTDSSHNQRLLYIIRHF